MPRERSDIDKVVEEAWRERWLKEREGRTVVRPADDFDHQQQTLFQDKTLKRHEGLTKAESSLLIQIRTGDIGLRDYLFKRKVPEVLTPYCECGEGRETAEHLVTWCLSGATVDPEMGENRDPDTAGFLLSCRVAVP